MVLGSQAYFLRFLINISEKKKKGHLSQRRNPQIDSIWGLGMLWQLGCHFHWYVSPSYGDRISVVKNDTCGFTAPKASRNNSLPTCFSCIKRAGKIHLHDHSEIMESPWQDAKEKKERKWSPSVMSDSVTPWTAACQASLSITNSQSSLRLTSIESVMPSTHLILCCSLLLPPSIFNLTVAVLACISTNSVRGFPFLHTLSSVYCL